MHNTVFELWRERTGCRVTCPECKKTETRVNWWQFRKFWRKNDLFECKDCEGVFGTQEYLVTPVMVIVNLEGLEKTVNYLVSAALNNASKRSTSLVGTAKVVKPSRDEVPQEEQSLELNVRIK